MNDDITELWIAWVDHEGWFSFEPPLSATVHTTKERAIEAQTGRFNGFRPGTLRLLKVTIDSLESGQLSLVYVPDKDPT